MRRAKQADDAYQQLLARLHHDRDDLLVMVRLRVGQLKALAGDWQTLHFLLSDHALEILPRLHEELHPHLRLPLEPTRSPTELAGAVEELREAIHFFNLRWFKHLAGIDLGAINQLRETHNRYYVLEKECAVRSAAVAKQGYEPLEPLTQEHLLREFPLLEESLLRKAA
jgi:hypothetical protein